MEAKHEFSSWQELLGHAIKNSQEKQRIAREVDVSSVTLRRWVSGESQPREENVLRLMRALPADLASLFLSLVEKQFPGLVKEKIERERVVSEISSELYAEVLQVHAKTPPTLVSQALSTLIIERALESLDPYEQGMAVTLVCCVPPLPGQKIRSLRQVGGAGTSPWERDLEKKTIFLGAESVAGSAVTSYRLASIDSRDSVSLSPVHWTEFENSAAAVPILRQARVAGALLASSTQPYYFTLAHRSLLELYANLAVLIFSPEEFYDPSQISLSMMPDLSLQKEYFVDVEQRVTRKLTEAMIDGSHLSLPEAHQRVWQEIAEELLRLSGGA